MTKIIEIEYQKINEGIYIFSGFSDDNYEVLEVEFEAYPSWENDGIGAYEHHGHRGYDYGHNYVSLENYGEPTWEKDKHTEEENEIILQFTKLKVFQKISDGFCEDFKRLNPIDRYSRF